MSVCPHDSTREFVGGFRLNLVRILCSWGIPYNRNFRFRTTGNINMAAEQIRDVGATLAPLAAGTYSDVWL
jgi:hypothetical protein